MTSVSAGSPRVEGHISAMERRMIREGRPDEKLFCTKSFIILQADKEFVWSLWKQLQVANPDLTQAVSLVVEREKHKTEMKDRKVLEILQTKDHRIQELEQVKISLKRPLGVSKKIMHIHVFIKEMKTEQRKKEEEEQRVVQALEEEKEGLRSRCAALSADLQEKQRQADSQRDERDAAQARLKVGNTGTSPFRNTQTLNFPTKVSLFCICVCRRDFAEVQALYRQSMEHAADQSRLIKQLEGLNLDTQRVLRNQEEAHSADTTSYQKVFSRKFFYKIVF
uniref:Uncharacterized protein n=1 Tax=Cyprinodon variegatus TaxID=28743 RepID=A0A3Q2GIT9_CYPVA